MRTGLGGALDNLLELDLGIIVFIVFLFITFVITIIIVFLFITFIITIIVVVLLITLPS